jgi:H+-transporting ATPase
MKENNHKFPPPLDADKVRSLEAQALLKYLKSNLNGLTSAEAQARLAFYGLNAIQEKRKSNLLKFLSYFWGPIAWMIEIAAILSAIIHRTEDLVLGSDSVVF